MKNHTIASLLFTTAVMVVGVGMYSYHDAYDRTNITYNEAVVISIGQCKDSRCSYTYKTQFGNIESGESSNPVSIGTKVYQQCWTEKARGDRCYVNYEPK